MIVVEGWKLPHLTNIDSSLNLIVNPSSCFSVITLRSWISDGPSQASIVILVRWEKGDWDISPPKLKERVIARG